MIRSIARGEKRVFNVRESTASDTIGLFLVFIEFLGENGVFSFEFFDDTSNVLHVHSFEILSREEGEAIRIVSPTITRCSPCWFDLDSCDNCSRFDVRVWSSFLRARWTSEDQCENGTAYFHTFSNDVLQFLRDLLDGVVQSIDSRLFFCRQLRDEIAAQFWLEGFFLGAELLDRGVKRVQLTFLEARKSVSVVVRWSDLEVLCPVDEWRNDPVRIEDVSNPISFARNYP